MIKKINKKAFTLIEVLVVVAIIGILTLLALPRVIGYAQKAELVRIQHDVKAMEKEIGPEFINGNDEFNKWGNNIKDLNQLVKDKELFEKEGVAKEVEPTDGTYKVIPKEYKAKINTKLKGTFYANSGGKVYYEHGEMPVYTDEEIDDLVYKYKYIPVATAEELDSIRKNEERTYGKGTEWEDKYTGGLGKHYVQVTNIDLSEYGGLAPIGTESESFKGKYDGGKYVITGLEVKGDGNDYQGLFGYTERATIRNVGLIDNKVTGKSYVGSLVGYTEYSTISNSYSTGEVTGITQVGGLVGYAWGSTKISNSYATGSVKGADFYIGGLVGSAIISTISNSYATGTVEGGAYVGGLVGYAQSGTEISNSYATGSVTGTGESVGGLVGKDLDSHIENSYATGSVTGNQSVGGLVGGAYGGTKINNSYATGSVTGTGKYTGRYVGGLVGYTWNVINISNSYATGSVKGEYEVGGLVGKADNINISNSYTTGQVTGILYVGGLVGYADSYSNIRNSYATGSITGISEVGGLIGKALDSSTATNSYWDTVTTKQENSARGEGKATDEMKKQITYSDWDFDTIWKIDEGNDYPKLR